MNQNQTKLLHRMFVLNEQIVMQNYQIMMALTQTTITKSKGWQGITLEELESIAQSYTDKTNKITAWGSFSNEIEHVLREKNK